MHWSLVAALLLSGLPEPSPAPPEPLSFAEFFDPSAQSLVPSARLRGLEGKRVRLTGFMAEMELPPKGGFYLCASPVFAGEGGGGTADLPPAAVLVVVRSAEGKTLAPLRRALEVTGRVELGPRADDLGRVSNIRILLDGPAPGPRRNR
jgi:hypothetical protein